MQRLLERRETTSLLQALTAQDIRPALIRDDGNAFSITDDLPGADLASFKDFARRPSERQDHSREITESDYFQRLREQTEDLRRTLDGVEDPADPEYPL